MPSSYPAALDPVSDPLVTTHGDVEDSIRAVQRTLGVNPQGSAATVAERIAGIVQGGGTTTDASLLTSGTLPVDRIGNGSLTNAKVAASAGISLDKTADTASKVAMTPAERTKLGGVAPGATANSSDAALIARANHTGTQPAGTIADFPAAARAQVEAELVAGTNVSITPSGLGATRTLTISAAGGSGGGSAARSVVRVTGSRTAQVSDASAIVVFDGSAAADLVIPADATTGFPVGTVLEGAQVGAGQVTVRGAGSTSTATALRTSGTFVRNTPSTSLDYNIEMPAGIQTGDTVLVFLSIADISRTLSMPTDWTFVGMSGPEGAGGFVFARPNAPASLSGTLQSFSLTSGTSRPPATATVLVLSGAHPTSPIDGSASHTNFDQRTPTLTTVNAGCLEVALVHASSGATVEAAHTTSDAALTMVQSLATDGTGTPNTRCAAAVGSAGARPAGTAIGNRLFSGGYGGAWTLAIRPGGSSSPVTLRAFSSQLKTAGPGADFYATKIGTDEWLVTGLLIA